VLDVKEIDNRERKPAVYDKSFWENFFAADWADDRDPDPIVKKSNRWQLL
jgi:hypothetical protein